MGLLAIGGATLWVMRQGADLQAPRKLAETWRLTSSCVPSADLLHIEQSGVFLVVHWPGGPVEKLTGRLDGERVRFRAAETTCGDGTAHGGGTWALDGLRAKVEIPGCGPCETAALDATPVAP